MEKEITLKIESATKGHETLTIPVSEAVDRVGTEVSENGKWLYCDGKFVSVDIVDSGAKARLSETLSQAKDITLAGTLLGG